MTDKIEVKDVPQFVVTVEGDLYGEDSPENREIVRRIHACVNACAGFSTEDLESGILTDLQQSIQNIVPLLQDKTDLISQVIAENRVRADSA